MARSLNQPFFNTTALCCICNTAKQCHIITKVQRSTIVGVPHNNVHLLISIPLSQYLNEEGVALGDMRGPETPNSHLSTWGQDPHFTSGPWMSALERPPTQIILLLLFLQESKILSLSQAIHIFEASQCPFCAGSLSAPRLSYYHLSTNVQNFHLVEISPEQIKQSSAVHYCFNCVWRKKCLLWAGNCWM